MVHLVANPHPLAFEVTVDGTVVFSKLEEGSFPSLEEVVLLLLLLPVPTVPHPAFHLYFINIYDFTVFLSEK